MNEVGGPRVSFDCTVGDVTALWDAAADHAAHHFAMQHEDVVETIGPREDPEIEACVAMLLDPLTRLRGVFETVTVSRSESGDQPPAPAASAPRKPSKPHWARRTLDGRYLTYLLPA